ncbi:GNAT family N-acetyltransferase [Psychromonas sp. psych-6C06]|uniref:GNAT family N-acetyltransferase n=1 Tax=Psychromonas sp. psych-6C06 TaxID=2058089 RepID=UPI000C3324AE|nr:GNAT family protein [Psychromonas sp. psych-6C06]PKF63282.1 GNAT family N-acetyltransferase [Psychromonas sp. psych-6C06]
MFTPNPVTLSTDKITLRPLSISHLDDFYRAGAFPELWQWSLPDQCSSKAQAADWLSYSETMTQQGEHVAFAIFDNQSGELVGSTRYCAISKADKNLEIGFTFITPKYQRSYVNTHAKYCLLKHAFEQLGAIRVQFKAHEKNTTSRNAIARLGATFEGILRHHRILPDGSYRNTAIFSIINHEWQVIKQQLESKL